MVCKIDGCTKVAPSNRRGWCNMHYMRWFRHDDPLYEVTWEHGTIGGYTNHRCRCDACKSAWHQYHANYRQSEKSREENRRKAKLWRVRHPDEHLHNQRIIQANRRTRKRKQFIESIDPQVVFKRDKGICGICKLPVIGDFHVDHIIPISKGGLHTYDNVQTAHPTCNMRKGSKLQEEICQTSNR